MLIRYRAVGPDGKRQSGEIEAENQRQALAQLAEMGLTPIGLDLEGGTVPWWQREIYLTPGGVSDSVLQEFLFNLSYMLAAKLPLLAAIEMIAQQTRNSRFRGILTRAAQQLKNGQPLSDALRTAEPKLNANVLLALQIG